MTDMLALEITHRLWIGVSSETGEVLWVRFLGYQWCIEKRGMGWRGSTQQGGGNNAINLGVEGVIMAGGRRVMCSNNRNLLSM
jgi:hypothetical protein